MELVTHSENIAELAAALSKAQGQIKGAIKDSQNPHFKSSYADLAAVWEACRTALAANGLAVVQIPGKENGDVVVTTMLTHSSGQWIMGQSAATPMKNDAQAFGSCTTYLRRYSLAAMVGVAPEDDDGEAASGRGDGQKAPTKPAAQKPAEQKQEAPRPYAMVKADGEEIHFERGGDYLKAIEAEFEAAPDKFGFWESNSAHFMGWQTKLVQSKNPSHKEAAVEFNRVGKEIADRLHEVNKAA